MRTWPSAVCFATTTPMGSFEREVLDQLALLRDLLRAAANEGDQTELNKLLARRDALLELLNRAQ